MSKTLMTIHPRRPVRRSFALLACLAACASFSVQAQEGVTHGPASAGGKKDAGTITLDAIKVTAEKSGRSLKDTPTSTVVLDAATLDERGIDDSQSVFEHIPNVTSSGAGNLAPAVRGVDGTGSAQAVDAFFAGSRARLNVQIDGRPASYNEVVFGNASLWDVEQVEMLRGPQSTLQGRNAMAGTLAIKTRDPSWTPEAGVRMVASNQAHGQAAFYLSGPLVEDQLAIRLSGDYQTRDSFVKFQSYPGASNPRKYAVSTLRTKLLFTPKALEGFSTLLTLQHADARGPQIETERRPFGEHQPLSPQMPVFEPRTDSAIADTRWQLTDRLHFENLLSATYLKVKRYAPAGTGIADIATREYMLEPRLRLDRGDGWLSGVAGIHLYRTDQHEFIDFPMDERFRDRVSTDALFGEGVIGLRDDLDLTVGARYEREHHRRHGGDGLAVAIRTDETDKAFLPKLGLAWRPDAQWTLGVFTSRGYNGGGGGVTFDVPIVNYSYKPEHVRNYEAYFRGDLAGGRLEWTGNVFYGDYRNMQLPFDLNPDPAIWAVVVRNAPRAKNYGAETGLRWRAAPGLELYGSLGLLKTRVTRYAGSGIEGNAFARAPTVTSDLGVSWHGASGFEAGANAHFSNGYYSTIENLPREHTDPYWLLNAKGGYRTGPLYTFVYVNNLLDNDTPLLLDMGATPDQDGASLPQPRNFGIGIEWDFL